MGHSPAANDGSRATHYVLLAAVSLVVISPALARQPKDDYPLSSYPMFSTNKDPKTTVSQAVALAGEEVTVLGPRFLGTDEVLQARATIARAVRAGPQATAALCADIARRVAERGEMRAATHVEIRTVTHDSLVYFGTGDTKPAQTSSHARCPVSHGK
jgi:hypothetical protein